MKIDNSIMESSNNFEMVVVGQHCPEKALREFSIKNDINAIFKNDIAEIFNLLEQKSPLALIWYLKGGENPIGSIEIVRSAGISIPIFLCCQTTIEANFYNNSKKFEYLYAWAGNGILPDAIQSALSVLAMQRARMNRPFPMEGDNLEDTPLACLLGEALRRQLNGQLQLKRAHSWRTLTMRDGEVVFADSSLLDENLGRFLLSQGIISRIEYRWSQRLQLREGIRQGEALVKIGVLNQQALKGILSKQIMQKLVNSFGGGPHTFSWEPADHADEPGSIHHFNIFHILHKALWRHLSQESIKNILADISHKSLIFLPINQRLNSLMIARWPALQDRPVGIRLKSLEIFSEMSEREQIAFVDTLKFLEVAVLVDQLPQGMEIKKVSGSKKIKDLKEFQSLVAQHLNESALTLPELLRLPMDTTQAILDSSVKTLLNETFSLDVFDATDEIYGPLKALRARLRSLLAHRPASHGPAISERRVRRRTRAFEAESAYQAGIEHLDSERYDEALSAFQLAQSLNDEEPLYMLYEGWTCVSMASIGDPSWERGKHLLEEAQVANPLMIESYALRARVALAEGQRAEARELICLALRFSPDHRQAKAMLEAIEQGDLPEDIQQEWPEFAV